MSGDSRQSRPKDGPDKIIEGLESLKDLFLKQDETPPAPRSEESAPDQPGEDVPLLDDLIDDFATDSAGKPGLADSVMDTLLGDGWQHSVGEVFESARNAIGASRTDWLPENTDALADALKVRLDATVENWLAETLKNNVDTLRQRIVDELAAELADQVKVRIAANKHENPE